MGEFPFPLAGSVTGVMDRKMDGEPETGDGVGGRLSWGQVAQTFL